MKIFRYLTLLFPLYLMSAPLSAFAAEGEPTPWQLGFQPAVSPSATHLHEFHNMLLWIIFGVGIVVLLLLIWVIIRYNAKTNPVPAKFTHHVLL
jgi:cytochrome c oxidase subunit 2